MCSEQTLGIPEPLARTHKSFPIVNINMRTPVRPTVTQLRSFHYPGRVGGLPPAVPGARLLWPLPGPWRGAGLDKPGGELGPVSPTRCPGCGLCQVSGSISQASSCSVLHPSWVLPGRLLGSRTVPCGDGQEAPGRAGRGQAQRLHRMRHPPLSRLLAEGWAMRWRRQEA